jgi:hypothetical protein
VLIKRPAVAPISEQPDTTDFRPAPLLLSMSVHGSSWDKRLVFGGI